MVINENCKVCQIKRNIDKYPLNATEEEIKEYQHKVKEIVENSDGLSTPQVAEKMDDLRRKIFGNVIKVVSYQLVGIICLTCRQVQIYIRYRQMLSRM